MYNRREFLLGASVIGGVAATAADSSGVRIRHVDIIHHTHTDVGYTDTPSVVREKQKRYLDTAIDLCVAGKAFRWTVESLVELDDWWQTAPAARRNEFLRLVRSGQMDVMGMPFNQTPFLNALQWRQMMSWIPAGLWRDVNPRAAMQNDVNGFPRKGAMLLLDRGIHHLLMGINSDSGGPPFRRPSAFWWQLPDNRKLFVWLGEHYGSAMRHLGAGRDGLPDDEQSVRAAHAKFVQDLRKLESDGYEHDRLILTFTHPAAYDNGWPYPSLAPFIEAWNRLGLQPSLRMATATEAVLQMEKTIGTRIPTLEGEWTDWWANGSASGPRELAASRFAKRSIAAAMSSAWGPMPADAAPAMERMLKDLCLFDEHTWGASSSISAPYSLNTQAQYTEKSDLAYRPMAHADWLLSRRIRTRIDPLPEGIYVVNPSPVEFSGWARFKDISPAADVRSVVDSATGAKYDVVRERGQTRFWVEKIAAHSLRALRPDTSPAGSSPAGPKPSVKTDARGWPESAGWSGMRKPLFEGGAGEFVAVELIPPADRRTITSLHANPDASQREAVRKKSLRQTTADYDPATSSETPHTLLYTQVFRHSRIDRAVRTLELWKREPRARITVRFDRLSSVAPELFYIAFDLPEGVPLPVFSCGGVPFTPYRDHLKGSCRDYIGIDGWAHYSTDAGDWLWVTRDAPLVVVGGPHALERHQAEPAGTRRIHAMVFDNCWHTNFVADSHGAMEFQFELLWREKIGKPADVAEALTADAIATVKPAWSENPALMKNLYRP